MVNSGHEKEVSQETRQAKARAVRRGAKEGLESEAKEEIVRSLNSAHAFQDFEQFIAHCNRFRYEFLNICERYDRMYKNRGSL